MNKKILFEHVGGNTFRMAQPQPLGMMAEVPKKRKQYSTEELQSIWEDDKDGEYIQLADDGSARYIAHGTATETIVPPTSQRSVSQFVGGDPRKKSITQDVPVEPGKDSEKQKLRMVDSWCEKHQFWPNIWYVNERGNIELVDRKTGEFLGGLV